MLSNIVNDKILGLDLGTKSLGIAISDSLHMYAHQRENFIYDNNDLSQCINKIHHYLKVESISKIVIGVSQIS